MATQVALNYQVAVKALAAFTAKRGDLDLRFTPAPSAEEGQSIHRAIQMRRGSGYQSEVELSSQYAGLRVSGRADGYHHDAGQIEEIKTHRVPVDRIPENHRALAWAQLKLYAAMLCQQEQLSELSLALTYVHVVSLEETQDIETLSAQALNEHFNQSCEDFLAWAESEATHRHKRDEFCRQLDFPFEQFRPGQRELSEQVYRACQRRHPLLAQATTGIGKTLGTLFPQIKAFSTLGMDRIFYLCAKTPGRRLALDALKQINAEAEPIRVLEMVSLDKACENPDKACHGDSCPLAQGFYDHLPAARAEAAETGWLDHITLARIARKHQLCPYWLSHEMAQWSDIVIGDYNYYFDYSAMLFALTQVNEWSVGVLVDEAHNLIPRARDMYSVELSEQALEDAMASAPGKIKSALRPVQQLWPNLYGTQEVEHQIYPSLPAELLGVLQKAVTQITSALADAPARGDGEYMRFFFDALAFCRLAEAFDQDSLFDVTLDTTNPLRVQSTLGIRNMIPASFLAPRFATARSATLFSATLIPPHYHQDLLGLPPTTQTIDVPSPFRPEQLDVKIAMDVSTRYRDRLNSLPRVARIISQQCQDQPGNYIAFFSSYEYLSQVSEQIRDIAPHLEQHCQRRGMSEIDRQRWLDDFTDNSTRLGLAVLGGAFSEGVDLPGKRLIGTFITTLGIPYNSLFNQALETRLEERFQQGFDYAYRYPGLQKVIQAAGRVIRDTQDSGVVYLLDQRYNDTINRQHLPNWWRVGYNPSPS